MNVKNLVDFLKCRGALVMSLRCTKCTTVHDLKTPDLVEWSGEPLWQRWRNSWMIYWDVLEKYLVKSFKKQFVEFYRTTPLQNDIEVLKKIYCIKAETYEDNAEEILSEFLYEISNEFNRKFIIEAFHGMKWWSRWINSMWICSTDL